jgi:uridine monophosphate synthetase
MLPARQFETLFLTLHNIGAVRFGLFTLPCGHKSPMYLDLCLLASYPVALRQAAAAALFTNLTVRYTCGIMQWRAS